MIHKLKIKWQWQQREMKNRQPTTAIIFCVMLVSTFFFCRFSTSSSASKNTFLFCLGDKEKQRKIWNVHGTLRSKIKTIKIVSLIRPLRATAPTNSDNVDDDDSFAVQQSAVKVKFSELMTSKRFKRQFNSIRMNRRIVSTKTKPKPKCRETDRRKEKKKEKYRSKIESLSVF